MNAVLQPLPVRGFRHLFQFAAQHFVDVGHLIKVVAAIVIHPLHHLIGAEGFFT
jgi:hypothetical protein